MLLFLLSSPEEAVRRGRTAILLLVPPTLSRATSEPLLSCFTVVLWLQLPGAVQPPAFPHLLPHAPIGHPPQPHQGAALPEVEVDPHRHHPADDGSLHLRQYLLTFYILKQMMWTGSLACLGLNNLFMTCLVLDSRSQVGRKRKQIKTLILESSTDVF